MLHAFSARTLIVGLALACSTLAAQAQDFPNRPIRIIIGPGSDLVPRLFGAKITEALGQPVVVEPRPGAGGVIAAQAVAAAPPDGTMLLNATASYTIGTAMGTMPVDLRKDFTPVGLAATAPFVLAVHPSVQANSVAELIVLAKSRPGALNYSSSGVGTPAHLAGELFKSITGVDIVHVPFRDVNGALTAVVSCSVQMTFAIATVAQGQVAAGTVRGLGVSTLQPTSITPGLPTIASGGVPGYEVLTWNGFVGPRGVPADAIAKLNAAITKALGDDEMRKRLLAGGYEPAQPNSPAEFGAYIARDTQKWIDLAASANIKAR